MQQQLKRMYFFATRNQAFIGNKSSNKYLPIKNDHINYETLFDVNQNLKQVHLNFQAEKTIKHYSLHHKGNKDNKHNLTNYVPTQQQSPKKESKLSPYKMPNLVQIYHDHKKKVKKQNKSKSVNPFQPSNKKLLSAITIIDNDEDDQLALPQKQKQLTQSSIKKFKKSKSLLKVNKNQYEVQEPQLDQYIDQYLQELLKQNNTNLRQMIQVDRKKFIFQAIEKIKKKIAQQKKNNLKNNSKQKKINAIEINIEGKNKNQIQQLEKQPKNIETILDNRMTIKQSSHRQEDNQEQSEADIIQEANIKEKTLIEQLIIKRTRIRNKPKSKSTHLMPSLLSGVQKSKNTKQACKQTGQKIFSTLNMYAGSAELPYLPSMVPNRKIYQTNNQQSSFITKIGKTFYINQLNVLNKTIELEAKNRQRAQRFFKRKLLNIQKQHHKSVVTQRQQSDHESKYRINDNNNYFLYNYY